MIEVSHTSSGPSTAYTLRQIEQVFHFKYTPSLTFDHYETEQWIRHRCARAYRKGMIPSIAIWLGQLHHEWLGATPPTPPFCLRWMNPMIGYGIVATRNLRAWECIGEYSGVVRRRGLRRRDVNDYCFVYPRFWVSWKPYTIDSEKQGNLTRFINHSSDPNVETVGVFYEGLFHIILRTIQDVQAGEELRYDYGPDYWKNRPIPQP